MPSEAPHTGGPGIPSSCAVELTVKETAFYKTKTCKISTTCKNTSCGNRQGVEIMSNREGPFGVGTSEKALLR